MRAESQEQAGFQGFAVRALAAAICGLIAPLSAVADTVTAKLDSVACSYHDVLWDKTGYDKEGKPTPEMLALDICKGISSGQKLELFERQNYAPGGLRIVRIDSKLYFVRMRDLEPVNKAAAKPPADKPAKAN